MLGGEEAREVCAIGRHHGLDAVGITSAAPFEGARAALEQRKAAGLHGGMQFTYRNPSRATDPQRSLPGARALVVGARAYEAYLPARPLDPARPQARVARYAVRDYYAALRAGLGAMADHLRQRGWSARVLADDNALVDRAAAHRAGLGWYGKNANLLLPGAGSWFVLGAVLTDAPLPATADEPVPDGCGACRRCIDGCPTGAIVAPGVIDARRCLAWLVQAEGDFPEQFRVALGDRLYGCDDCQEVCPPNRRSVRAGVAAEPGRPETASPDVPAGVAPPRTRPPGDATGTTAWVDVVGLLEAGDAELLERFGRWYIPRRDPRYLRRNALVVLGNSERRSPAVDAVLRRYLDHPDEMLRSHASWAARRRGRARSIAPAGAGGLAPAQARGAGSPGDTGASAGRVAPVPGASA